MDSQKFENILNLSLEVTDEERIQSEILDAAYNDETGKWDLIVRYAGDIEYLRDMGIQITYLISNYAIISAQKNLIDKISDYNEIIYVEIPKLVYSDVMEARNEACITAAQRQIYLDYDMGVSLNGEGIICAVIDSGIDIFHPVFRNNDGTTRILEIWDQNVSGNPPAGYNLGSVFYEEDINTLLVEYQNRKADIPTRDLSGHGTFVAGVMAGNFAENKDNNIGIATKSKLIVVKLNTTIKNGYPRTTELMQAVSYVYERALFYGLPVSINLSFGNAYGSHNGSSLIETFLDSISDRWKMCISVGTGNEAAMGGHFQSFLSDGMIEKSDIFVGEFETTLDIQIWKSFEDKINFFLVPPATSERIPIINIRGKSEIQWKNEKIIIFYGGPSPYSTNQEIFIVILPVTGNYISSGRWSVEMEPENIVTGQIDMWLTDSASLSGRTRFAAPAANVTLTIPSTAEKVISVGAYDSDNLLYAGFSGRGYTRLNRFIKPELVAPGVNIMSAAVGGGFTMASGTSTACPFVSGSAALLMQYGIVLGNDVYLYGDKLKAYLIKGTKRLRDIYVYPNELVGYGALCLKDSIII